jgi:hypothetical protein
MSSPLESIVFYTLKDIDEYSAAQIDTDMFNSESRRVQEIAGVNPDDCISLTDDTGTEVTHPMKYLAALGTLKYLLPATGSWRDHDSKYHVRTIRSMHPDTAALVANYARYGQQLLIDGNQQAADGVVDTLDLFLSDASSRERMYTMLWQLNSKAGADMISLVRQSSELQQVQTDHQGLVDRCRQI